VLVQLLAAHAWLDDAVEILGMDLDDPVHQRQVQADPAAHGGEITLQRGAGAEGNNRDPVRAAQVHEIDHLLGRAGEDNRVGQHLGVVALAGAVLAAHVLRGREALAEAGLQGFGEGLRQGLTCDGEGGMCGHGNLSSMLA
jgi:hypothetical protein